MTPYDKRRGSFLVRWLAEPDLIRASASQAKFADAIKRPRTRAGNMINHSKPPQLHGKCPFFVQSTLPGANSLYEISTTTPISNHRKSCSSSLQSRSGRVVVCLGNSGQSFKIPAPCRVFVEAGQQDPHRG